MSLDDQAFGARGSRLGRGSGGFVLVATAVVLLACSGISRLVSSDPVPEEIQRAQQQIADGDLPVAAASFRDLYDRHPYSVDVASGYAYVLVLQGQLDEADAVLEQLEPTSEVNLRRAMIARRQNAHERLRELALASGTPAGKVMAAEVMIATLQVPEAVETLLQVAAGAGPEARAAREYLGLLQHDDARFRTLARPVALWSLGKRQEACEGASRVLEKLPASDEKSELLLLWAGRAVTSGLPRVARGLVDEVNALPDDQRWRQQATSAIIDIAEGNSKEGLATFAKLRMAPGVPADGLEDALVTACSLAADAEVAQALVEDVNMRGAARCLLEVGAVEAARTRQSGDVLGPMLENMP